MLMRIKEESFLTWINYRKTINMKKKKLTLTEELNEMKKVMKNLLNEDINLEVPQKFYGDVVSCEFLGSGEKNLDGDFCVLVTTQKDGVDYLEIELGCDINITYYHPPSRSNDYYEPDDPGDLEFDITLIEGTSKQIEDSEDDIKFLSKEELSIIQSDQKLIDKIYNMDSVQDIAWENAERGNERDDYDGPDDDYYDSRGEDKMWGGMDI